VFSQTNRLMSLAIIAHWRLKSWPVRTEEKQLNRKGLSRGPGPGEERIVAYAPLRVINVSARWRRYCPPQGEGTFAYFCCRAISKASGGTRSAGFDFDLLTNTADSLSFAFSLRRQITPLFHVGFVNHLSPKQLLRALFCLQAREFLPRHTAMAARMNPDTKPS